MGQKHNRQLHATCKSGAVSVHDFGFGGQLLPAAELERFVAPGAGKKAKPRLVYLYA